MDILLFALFNFIALFFLLLSLSNKDIISNIVSFVILLLIGFMVLTGSVSTGYAINGFSAVTSSVCTAPDNQTTTCFYGLNNTAASVTSVDLIADSTMRYGLSFLYGMFAAYVLIVSALRLRI